MRNIILPDDKLIKQFAHEVCSVLASRHNDGDYLRGDVVNGLAGLVKLAGRIQAKKLTDSGEDGFDSVTK